MKSKVKVVVSGKVISELEQINKFGKTKIYRTVIETKRLSGVSDKITLNIPDNICTELGVGTYIEVEGDLRTVNRKNTDFVISCYVMVNNLTILDEEPSTYKNDVFVENATIYSDIESRKSYDNANSDIANFRISLDRGHGRISYVYCTAWNHLAVSIKKDYEKGSSVNFSARLQSFVSKRSHNEYICMVLYKLQDEKQ